MSIRFDLHGLNEWFSRNRLIVWWLLWVPLFLLVVAVSWGHLGLSSHILENMEISLWYKVLNAVPILILLRLVALGFGLALLLVCLFFPLLRVSTQGVSWNLESYEAVAKLAGEAAGEEVELLVMEETRRWRMIQSWLQIQPETLQPSAFFWEFLFVLHDIFPEDEIHLLVHHAGGKYAVTHPFLSFLTNNEISGGEQQIQIIFFLGQEEWLITICTSKPEGYSPLDQEFLSSAGAVFAQAVYKMGRKELFPDLAGFEAVEVNQSTDKSIK
jgi:hypothetical protein